jgi:hypothetical protein
MTVTVVAIFAIVYLGMILGGLPFVQLDRPFGNTKPTLENAQILRFHTASTQSRRQKALKANRTGRPRSGRLRLINRAARAPVRAARVGPV